MTSESLAAIAALDASLSRLSVDYWYEVDHHAGRRAHEFFADPDCFYQIQDAIFSGRDEIRRFYAWRGGRGNRVARHCMLNARATFIDTRTATMDSILLLHAADGDPILPTAPPIQIADVRDECVFLEGAWRFKSKRLTTLFAGGVPITLPTS